MVDGAGVVAAIVDDDDDVVVVVGGVLVASVLEGLHDDALLFLGVQMKVQVCSIIGKRGSMFLGRCSSSLADCSTNAGHLL